MTAWEAADSVSSACGVPALVARGLRAVDVLVIPEFNQQARLQVLFRTVDLSDFEGARIDIILVLK